MSSPLRFAVIGNGAIATELLRLIAELGEAARGLEFVGTVTREPRSLDAALTRADVVVEAAGVGAVREYAARVTAASRDLIVASIGAFADTELLAQVRAAGPGRLHLTSGAIGGLDLLAAAGRTGGLDRVRVRSQKLPTSLVQAWMTDDQRTALLALDHPQTLFRGTPAEAIERFPSSLNVAVAVSLAVGASAQPGIAVEVELIADPAALLTSHEITASGLAGEYSFTIKNTPLAARPASSGLTARALVADLLRLSA